MFNKINKLGLKTQHYFKNGILYLEAYKGWEPEDIVAAYVKLEELVETQKVVHIAYVENDAVTASKAIKIISTYLLQHFNKIYSSKNILKTIVVSDPNSKVQDMIIHAGLMFITAATMNRSKGMLKIVGSMKEAEDIAKRLLAGEKVD